jgi:2-polyprenyl-6-methoxyphenol hydroxylase-like FAD-dependent oxidoreductase
MDNRIYPPNRVLMFSPMHASASDNIASISTTRWSPSSNIEITQPSIVVIGAGLTGMACALMLAKRNLPVVVLERDTRDRFGQSGEHPARRVGAPHANRPHFLLAGGRDVLLRSLPEVARELYMLGARDATVWAGVPATPDLTLLIFRRMLLERAFLSCAQNLPTLILRFGDPALGLVMKDDHLCGVRTGTTTVPARLVIDASGALTQLLRRTSCSDTDYLQVRSDLYYTSRLLRLTRCGYDAASGAAVVWIKSPSQRVVHVRLFLHDAPYASILLVLRGDGHTPSRCVIDEAYQAVMSDNNLRPYCQGAVCLTPIEIVGFLRARLRLLDNERSFQPAGLLQIGDALAQVNPLTSRGASLGLIQAEALTTCIARNSSDYTSQCEAVLRTYHEWVLPNWADSVIRDNFLRPDLNVPKTVSDAVDLARRRWRLIHTARRDASVPSTPSQMTELATRVAQLRTPPSTIDSFAEVVRRCV